MADLNTLLATLDGATAAEATAEADLEAAKSAVREARTAVKDAVQAGLSTGDAVRDFVLRKEGDEGELARYQALNEAVVGKEGELLVGLYQDEHMTRHTFGRGGEFETVYRS